MQVEKELAKAFQKIKYEENPELAKNIWLSISARETRNAKVKAWVSLLAGILSLAGFFFIIKTLLQDLASSGIYEYISVAFSGSNMLSYWKELSLSIAESLPIESIVLSLSLIFILFLSLKYAVRQMVKSQLLPAN